MYQWSKFEQNFKLIAFYVARSGADPTDKCGIHYSPLQMAAEQGAIRALKAAFECLPAGLKKNQRVLDSILLGVFQSSCYECVTGLGNLCQRCLGGDTEHPADATWTGVLDFLTELNYKPSKEYLESMKEFPGKRKLFAYYSSKLRGEEPKVIAEGPGLGRRPLSLMQPSSLSNFLSALGQFGDISHSGGKSQKQLQSSKAIIPKSATCENCKEREKKMMVCGQCRQAYYCSRECQKKNWKEHKKSCSPRREWWVNQKTETSVKINTVSFHFLCYSDPRIQHMTVLDMWYLIVTVAVSHLI